MLHMTCDNYLFYMNNEYSSESFLQVINNEDELGIMLILFSYTCLL